MKRIKPRNDVILVDLKSVQKIDKKEISVTDIGEKGYGLTLIPKKWTLPFFIINKSVFKRYKNSNSKEKQVILGLIEHICKQALNLIGLNQNDNIIIRSSSEVETIKKRGCYYSYDGNTNQLKDLLQTCFDKHIQDEFIKEDGIPFILQKFIKVYSEIGHLSNEKRIDKDNRIWLYTCNSPKRNEEEFYKISLKKWRNKIDPSEYDNQYLSCEHKNHLQHILKKIAFWANNLKSRMHFEWIWDGSKLFLLQADEEIIDDSTALDPKKLILNNSVNDYIPKCLIPIDQFKSENEYDKLKNTLLYQELNLFSYSLYVLNNKLILKELSKGIISEELNEDLEFLANHMLMIRTDIPSNKDKEDKQMLPRTEGNKDLQSIKEWLIDETGNLLETTDDFIFIFHNFIPSISSAFAYVEPNNKIVRIESIYGIPEGLYFQMHDKYTINTRFDDISLLKPENFDIQKKIGYKEYFISSDSDGKWTRKALKSNLSYSESILSDNIVKYISANSRRICNEVNEAISIMWFIGVNKTEDIDGVIPWFHESHEGIIKNEKLNLRAKTIFDRYYTIKCQEDITDFNIQFKKNKKSIKFIKIDPDDISLLRDKNWIRSVGELANRHDATILMEGGFLCHAYYQLKSTGANIISPNEFKDVQEELNFNKLVRDFIPKKIEKKGEIVEYAVLEKDILVYELQKKLVEEALEVLDTNRRGDIVEEIADVMEVVDSIKRELSIDNKEIVNAKNRKKDKLGGFSNGVVLLGTKTIDETTDNASGNLFNDNIEELQQNVYIKEPLKETVHKHVDNLKREDVNTNRVRLKIPILNDSFEVDFIQSAAVHIADEPVDLYIHGKRNGIVTSLHIELSSRRGKDYKQLEFDF